MAKTDKNQKSNKILILGASGFIGNALYKELCNYFDTYGTYFTQSEFQKNKQFIHYSIEEDDVYEILERLQPDVIISALRGNFTAQVMAHQHMVEYVLQHNTHLYFISAANVFDAYSKYPSYENDKTLSLSVYGHFKIKIENMLMRLPQEKWTIIRLPMVFGKGSPRIKEIKQLSTENISVEVFPNLIINVTHDFRFTQQMHYLINRKKRGIFHLGSNDLVHHEDFIAELVQKSGIKKATFKKVYTTNEDRFLAVLPKSNKLPKHLQITYEEVLEHHVSP
jgi:dTDP-4-dehydrorhamnose reductase